MSTQTYVILDCEVRTLLSGSGVKRACLYRVYTDSAEGMADFINSRDDILPGSTIEVDDDKTVYRLRVSGEWTECDALDGSNLLYAPKKLTEAQKEQARENIGAVSQMDCNAELDIIKSDLYAISTLVSPYSEWSYWNTQKLEIDCNEGRIDVIFPEEIIGMRDGGIETTYFVAALPLEQIHVRCTLNYCGKTKVSMYTKSKNGELVHVKQLSIGINSFSFTPKTEEFRIIIASRDSFSLQDIKMHQQSGDTLMAQVHTSQACIEENKMQNRINAYMTSPDGHRYVTQIIGDGTVVAIPVVPSKALYVGNSLLCGFGFGMAASDNEHDYYHLVNKAIRGFGGEYTSTKMSGTTWEACTTHEAQNDFLTDNLLPNLTDDLELVIVQLGDNVNTDEKKAVFEQGAKNMLQFIRTSCPKARVAWIGAWYQTTEKQAQMRSACNQTGSIFIDIWDLATSENKSAVGNTYIAEDGTVQTITSEGVASHPGDAGFMKIANRVLYVLGITDSENYYAEAP